MWIYMTPAVTSYVYGATDTNSAGYNEGADWVGICFAVYNGVAALVAFLLPVIARHLNRKLTHSDFAFLWRPWASQACFFIDNPNLLLISMVGVGIAWASILSMPYAIISSILPPNKMGYYMGVFNFFIVIPQIVAAGLLGFILHDFFGNVSIYALLIGAASFALSGLLCLIVDDNDVEVDFAEPTSPIEPIT